MSFELFHRPRKGKLWLLAQSLHECSYCGASPGLPCRDTSGRMTPPHYDRGTKGVDRGSTRKSEKGPINLVPVFCRDQFSPRVTIMTKLVPILSQGPTKSAPFSLVPRERS